MKEIGGNGGGWRGGGVEEVRQVIITGKEKAQTEGRNGPYLQNKIVLCVFFNKTKLAVKLN